MILVRIVWGFEFDNVGSDDRFFGGGRVVFESEQLLRRGCSEASGEGGLLFFDTLDDDAVGVTLMQSGDVLPLSMDGGCD